MILHKYFKNKIIKKILLALGCLLIIFIAWQGLKKVPIEGTLEVSRGFISTIENGKKTPTLSTITKLAKALGVSTDELLK